VILHPVVLTSSKHYPHISNASIVIAFRQGVRDKKMLEKLATYDVQDVSELFSLVDKCVRATEGRAWHSQPTPEARKAGKPDTVSTTKGSGKSLWVPRTKMPPSPSSRRPLRVLRTKMPLGPSS
jgi:hypothetical protein